MDPEVRLLAPTVQCMIKFIQSQISRTENKSSNMKRTKNVVFISFISGYGFDLRSLLI